MSIIVMVKKTTVKPKFHLLKTDKGSVGNVLNFIFEKQYSRFIPLAERDDDPQH